MSARESFVERSLRLGVVGLVVGVAVLAGGCATAGREREGAWQQRSGTCVVREGFAQPEQKRGVPAGWPEQADSDEEVLAPLLACGSVREFLALQRRWT